MRFRRGYSPADLKGAIYCDDDLYVADVRTEIIIFYN
jgi:hypothetical protein